ncbi:CRAL/TRIO domain-containing protein [Mollisia scopiformis]|uniref:Phosphatidylinositol transfer protein SFH5 n=1 Tax=Mollisia scopiformis TaxID=149040 RepID=A0A194XB16_MOLSC|nr:CRAL/TRIO domain-containing protein [Mollisia scopiformis]KUJ17370.1 CRAL/TRIO domain-containing protein [Mollisia scopiformis]
MATATEPVPGAEEKKIEASEAPSQVEKPETSETAPASVPAVEEKKVEAEPTPKPETSDGPVVVPPPASAVPASTTPEKKAVAFDGSAEEKSSTPTTPLQKLFAELPAIIKEADYGEMWEVELLDADVPTSIVLEKFLRANTKDIAKAKAQLIEALKWRKTMQPKKLLETVEFDSEKFGGLGYVTVYRKTESHPKEIVTWNIYGSVKDKQATFGNVEEFVKWRAALMELSVKELDLASATVPIPAAGVDPYRMVQVHDYNNVSFLRMDPSVKAASKETIQVFSMAYPELLKEKFFVNVPVVMGWVFAAMKLFLSPETVKKFHPLSYGSSLAGELKGWGQELPTAYGGKGKDIQEGLTVKYGTSSGTAIEDAPPAATETTEKK